ncbi:alpha/beta fold hydrolase [Nocardia callitridis]|uniref:Alpha/beta hydrolase n=1 Tax=Nocardia callitridis TaxID=648753 RepID=A0ABP9K438_9NOCA
MRAMSPNALVPARGGGRFADHRAKLRTRTYQTAALNPPTAPREVIPVTARDGAELRVHAYGPEDGPALVLAHGWTCCLEYWNPQINAFADKYRVIAYDQRGHGDSDFGSSPLSMDLLADDLADVLAAALAPGEKAALVGHSLGAMTVQAWAGRYPHRVAEQLDAVVLTNTGPDSLVAETTLLPLLNKPLGSRARRIPMPRWLGRIGLGMPLLFPPIAPFRRLFANGIMSKAATGDVLDFSLSIVRSCPALVRAKYGVLLSRMDVGQAARKLVVPTTVIAGEFDDLTPAVHAERICRMLADTGSLDAYRLLPTGHLGNAEAYAEFNLELARVLESVRDRGQPDADVEIAG